MHLLSALHTLWIVHAANDVGAQCTVVVTVEDGQVEDARRYGDLQADGHWRVGVSVQYQVLAAISTSQHVKTRHNTSKF